MKGTGLAISSSCNNEIDTTNKVNGKSLRYYENTQGEHLAGGSDVGQLILLNCNDSIFEGLDIADIGEGIMVIESFNCVFSTNVISH